VLHDYALYKSTFTLLYFALLAAISVTTWGTAVWRHRVHNIWPVVALTARSEARYWLIIAISVYPTCIQRPRWKGGPVGIMPCRLVRKN